MARMTASPTERPWGIDARDRFGLLVVLLVAVLLVSGVSDDGWVRLCAGVLNAVAFVVGYRATRTQSALWTAAGVLLVGLVGAIVVGSLRADELGGALGATTQVILLGTLTLAVVSRVLDHERVTNQTILGAIAAYLLIGQVFAWVYLALPGLMDEAVVAPGRLGELPVYYSYVVLTTLGFGDITPTGALAQRVTVLEALLGQLFLAILLARLVSVYSRTHRQAGPGR